MYLRSLNAMDLLPTEILTHIFCFLDVKDFLNVSEVCKRFEKVMNLKIFVEKICANITHVQDFKDSQRNYVNIKLVNLYGKDLEKCNESSLTLRKLSPSVQRVKLDNVEIFDTIPLLNVFKNFQHVTEIHMEGVYIKLSPTTTKPIQFHNLRVLKFFYNSNELLNIFSNVKNHLKVFKLCLVPHGDEEIKTKNFKLVTRILNRNRTTLEKLNLYDVNFDDIFLDKLSRVKFQRLSRFSMSFNSYLLPDSPGFKRFVASHVVHLEKFKVRSFDHIDQERLKILIDHSENLRTLNLIVCPFCNYDSFAGFKNLKSLENLKLQPVSYCSIGNTCYQSFVEDKILNHPNIVMKSVTIKHLTNISENVINRITTSFPNLEMLDVTTETEMSLSNSNNIRNKLKYIKRLVLNGLLSDSQCKVISNLKNENDCE